MTHLNQQPGLAEARDTRGRDWVAAASLFLVLLGVYMATYAGRIVTIDELGLVASMESLVKRGSFELPQLTWYGYTKGVFEPAQIVLAGAFYAIGMLLPGIGAVQAAYIFNVVITAATGSLLFLYVRRLGYSRAVGILVTLIWGLSTTAWVYSKFLFREPLATLFLLAAVFLARGLRPDPGSSLPPRGWQVQAVLAASALGLALATKEAMILAFPVVGFVAVLNVAEAGGGRLRLTWPQVKVLSALGVAAIACLALIMLYNTQTLGAPSLGGRGIPAAVMTALSLPPEVREAMAEMPFNVGKGLFTHSPVLLLALFSVPLLIRARRISELVLPWLLTLVFFRAYAAVWWIWWGGWTWGPRYFVPLLPFLAAALAPAIQYLLGRPSVLRRLVLAIAVAAGVVVQMAGSLVSIRSSAEVFAKLGQLPGWATGPLELRYSEILIHLQLLRPENLDLAWVGVRDGQVAIDWLPPALCLLVVAGGVAGLMSLRGHALAKRRVIAILAAAFLSPLLLATLTLPRYYEPAHFDWEQGWSPLLKAVAAQERGGDVMIMTPPAHSEFTLNYSKARLPWYALNREIWPSQQGPILSGILADYRRVWLATDVFSDGDEYRGVERWLCENAFKVSEARFGYPARLMLFLAPWRQPPNVAALQPVAQFGDAISLMGAVVPTQTVHAGDVVPVSLYWRAGQVLPADYTVSLQLLDASGRLFGQVDSQPVSGFRPTSSWQPGEIVTDNYAIKVAEGAAPGIYTLALALYSQPTLARLPVSAPESLLFSQPNMLIVGLLGVDQPAPEAPYPILR